jgi:DNA-binding beta-propeller fold protein YncE
MEGPDRRSCVRRRRGQGHRSGLRRRRRLCDRDGRQRDRGAHTRRPDTKRLILGADESFLYVPGYDGSVRIITTADHTVTTIYGSSSTAEVVSPSGRHLYTAHIATSRESADSVISATATDSTSMTTVAIKNYATGMDLSPDGDHLYVATSRLSS